MGESVESKLDRVGQTVGDCEWMVLSNLDEIAWILNMRGNDIPYNPYFYSYVLLNFKDGKFNGGTLYMKKEKFSKEVIEYLTKLKFAYKEYDQFYNDLNKIEGLVSVDLSQTNSRIHRELF